MKGRDHSVSPTISCFPSSFYEGAWIHEIFERKLSLSCGKHLRNLFNSCSTGVVSCRPLVLLIWWINCSFLKHLNKPFVLITLRVFLALRNIILGGFARSFKSSSRCYWLQRLSKQSRQKFLPAFTPHSHIWNWSQQKIAEDFSIYPSLLPPSLACVKDPTLKYCCCRK